jgi:hypothetical protein
MKLLMLLNATFCSVLNAADVKNQAEKSLPQAMTINIKSFGAKGDNLTDETKLFIDAIGKIRDKVATIEISDGTFVVDKVMFPENITLKFFNAGKIAVAKGGIVEVNGGIDSGLSEIFTGDGAITGRLKTAYVYPQWFGANADEKNDAATAIQKAADLAKFSSGRTLFIPSGRYRIDKSIEISCNVECRGVLVKYIEVDEAKTKKHFFTFTPEHYLKNNPMIYFKPDAPFISLSKEYFSGIRRNDFKVGKFENIPLADKAEVKINLEEGGG